MCRLVGLLHTLRREREDAPELVVLGRRGRGSTGLLGLDEGRVAPWRCDELDEVLDKQTGLGR